jgi:quinoprotein glucose dehydrogenase
LKLVALTAASFVAIGLAVPGCDAPAGNTAPPSASEDWTSYGGDVGSTKYSALDQITAENVGDIDVAWSWESADYRPAADAPRAFVNNVLQATPLKVGDRLFTTTNLGQAAALDPGSGEELWRFDPHAYEWAGPATRANRGPAYWTDGTEARVFLISGERLVSLDADSGAPAGAFGVDGAVDLAQDPDPRVTRYFSSSAPLVVGDIVVVGSTFLAENRNWQRSPPGYVRAYDVRTGEQRWRFNPIPGPGEPGSETWLNGSNEYTGHASAWTLMSADPALGLVYLPLKTTTNDWYGGHRPGGNLYGESLVAVDADTGERVWHFQMVHHGLWDYDPPAAPILGDVTVDGERIPAVFQVTKQAFVFAFDRRTGEPLWPIEERPVPTSPVPGEWTSPTQPFPTRPAPFDLQGITEDDFIDFTPELRAEALEIASHFVYGEMFTTPTVRDDSVGGTQGTILMPGWVGGANWNGAAFDPETGFLYVPSVTSPNVTALVDPADDVSDFNYVRGLPREVPLPGGLPLLKPPYGRITAIDMNTGDHQWMKANGPGPRDHEAIADLDLPWLGQRGRPGPLLTKSLFFIGEGSKDALSVLPIAGGPMFRAYDKATGDVVWEIELAAGTSGAPMSYMHNGRQYIVVAIGDAETTGRLVALALPN